jgi:dihydrofolate reductase
MVVYLIASMSKNGIICVSNHSTHFRAKWFAMNTVKGAIVMGRKTWESLGPFPNCTNIIISRQYNHSPTSTVEWCTTISEAIDIAGPNQNVYIIGGSEIFHSALLLELVDACMLTYVDVTVAKQPSVSLPVRKVAWTSEQFSHDGVSFHFELSVVKKKGFLPGFRYKTAR